MIFTYRAFITQAALTDLRDEGLLSSVSSLRMRKGPLSAMEKLSDPPRSLELYRRGLLFIIVYMIEKDHWSSALDDWSQRPPCHLLVLQPVPRVEHDKVFPSPKF